MRIREIGVTKLFGIFNHTIPLRMKERITLIHGPNGFGKTIILRMVSSLFLGQYSVFRTVPFERFRVVLDDGTSLEVDKPANKGKSPRKARKPASDISVRVLSPAGDELYSSPLTPSRDESRLRQRSEYLIHLANREFGLRQVGPWEWVEVESGELLGPEDIIERYGDTFPAHFFDDLERKASPLSEIQKSIDVRLIRAQRLDAIRRERGEERATRVPTVKMYSDEIAKTINAALADYASKSQELDRTFPSRLFRQQRPTISADTLSHRMDEIEKRRTWLTGLGFLDKEAAIWQASENEVAEKLDVLSVYVADVEQKLGVFEDLASRVDLLIRTVNARFKYKQMSVRKDTGIVFQSETGENLSPTALSSGEQHELVLLYELLFKTRKNSLVMIDEPEISLHIAWQEEFLNDLIQIVDASDFDVLIATHSSEIIGNHLDLAVALSHPS